MKRQLGLTLLLICVWANGLLAGCSQETTLSAFENRGVSPLSKVRLADGDELELECRIQSSPVASRNIKVLIMRQIHAGESIREMSTPLGSERLGELTMRVAAAGKRGVAVDRASGRCLLACDFEADQSWTESKAMPEWAQSLCREGS